MNTVGAMLLHAALWILTALMMMQTRDRFDISGHRREHRSLW